ncbi:PEP-CTERM sorting domain-containing protein [Rubripirellula tenax]|nr:PEP-CTERM sorting domain-containing protein [Rubripirellula tenax]
MRSSTFSGFAQPDRAHSVAYQFLDATTASGTYQFNFEYYNDDIGSSIAVQDSIASVNIYGIKGSTWTTTSGFTSFGSTSQAEVALPTPVISGAILTPLGSFFSLSQTDQWQSGSFEFDLGAGGYDTVAVRLGARYHVTGPSRTAFDNIALTAVAVPEPSTALTFTAFGIAAIGLRRLRLRRDRRRNN